MNSTPRVPSAALTRRAFHGIVAGAAMTAVPVLRAQNDNRIVLGQSAAFSGAAAQLGIQFNAGAKLHFDAINAQGGINGLRVSIAQLDDGYDNYKCCSAHAALALCCFLAQAMFLCLIQFSVLMLVGLG